MCQYKNGEVGKMDTGTNVPLSSMNYSTHEFMMFSFHV